MSFRSECIKCLLIGDADVGKAELVVSYTHDTFPAGDLPVFVITRPIKLTVDGRSVLLSLDDSSGQEDDFQLRRLSYATADVIILCYSVASRRSFENVRKKWAVELRLECPNVPVILAGNNVERREYSKGMLHPDDMISPEQGELLARTIGARQFLECSAVTQYNVFYLFYEAAKLALAHVDSGQHASGKPSRFTTSSGGRGLTKVECCFPFNRTCVVQSWLRQPYSDGAEVV